MSSQPVGVFVLMGDTGERENDRRYFEDRTGEAPVQTDSIEFPREGTIGEQLQVWSDDRSWRTVLVRRMAEQDDQLLPAYAEGAEHEIPAKMMKPGPWISYRAGSPLVAVSQKSGVARVFAHSCSIFAARIFRLVPPAAVPASA